MYCVKLLRKFILFSIIGNTVLKGQGEEVKAKGIFGNSLTR
jgi:hypothetical protein